MESGGSPADLLRMARVCAVGETSAVLVQMLVHERPPAVPILSARTLERAVDFAARGHDMADERAHAQPRVHLARLVEASAPLHAGSTFLLDMLNVIAENHGGDLAVDPGRQGRGACVTRHLPVAAARA